MPEKEPPKIKPAPKPEASPQASVKKGAEKQPEKPKVPTKPTSPEVVKAREALEALTNKKSELGTFADVKDVKTIEYITSVIRSSQKKGTKDMENILDDVMVKLKEGIDAGSIKPTPEIVNKLRTYALKHNRPEILPSMGGGAGPTGAPQVYDETPGAEPLITDSDLIRKLREINFNLRTNSLYQNDIHRLNNDADSIGRLGLENKDIPEDQIKEATERINTLIEKAQVKQADERLAQQQKLGRDRIVLTWGEMRRRGFADPDPAKPRPDDNFYVIDHISQENVDLILSGWEGQWAWFRNFVHFVYTTGRTPGKPDLPDTYEFKAFEDLLRWAYGKDGESRVKYIKQLWDTEGRRNGIAANISHSGGDAKKKLEGMAYLTPHDIQHEQTTYAYSNFANSFMEQSLFDKASQLRATYDENVGILKRPDLATGKTGLERFKDLDKKRQAGTWTQTEQLEYAKLKITRDSAGIGVIIKDDHMLHREGIYNQLVQLQSQYDDVVQRERLGTISADLRGKKGELDTNIKKLWKDFTDNPYETFGPENGRELTAYAELSPIEIETYRRLESHLKAQGMTDEDMPPWKLRDAVLSARRTFIGTGRAVTIAANVASMPAFEVAPEGRDVMQAAFAEQLVRLENVELFMYRFNMGGKYGEVSRSILDLFQMERQGYKIDTNVLLKPRNEHESIEMTRARTAFAIAQETSGIPFTELLRKKLLGTGFIFDGTTWRMDIAVQDQIRARILEIKDAGRLGANDVLDNLALGVQLALAGTGKDAEPLRRNIIQRMIERTPSRILDVLGKQFDDVLNNHGFKVNSKEWATFKRALAIAEVNLWENDDLRLAKINLGNRRDFDRVFGVGLTRGNIFRTLGVNDATMIDRYFNVLRDTQVMTTGRTLDEWAKRNFPITLTLSDFNWKDTRFDFLSQYTHERRMINDQLPKLEAMGMTMDLLTKTEYLSPTDPEKTTFPKIKELRDKIVNWTIPDDAEDTAKMLSRVFYTMNLNRAATRSIWGWIPGAVSLMKNLSEVDLRKDSLPGKALIALGVPEGVVEHKIGEWPHSIGQAVSHSIRFVGPEGPAYDEFKIEYFIRHQQKIGTFAEHPEFANDLRREFRTGLPYRFMGTARKYWWTIPAATIALASVEAVEEEKKKSH